LEIRELLSGLGAAEDPDIEDYYTKVRGFPIVYSPNDDPKVLKDMQAVAAELAGGADGDENLSRLESESSDSENGEDGVEGDWEDEDKTPAKKRTKKLLSCVEKVCCSRSYLVLQC
jgi:hypothetical protein